MTVSDSGKAMAAFAERAVQLWAPGANMAIRRILTEGKSGALVQLVDIEPPGYPQAYPPGNSSSKLTE